MSEERESAERGGKSKPPRTLDEVARRDIADSQAAMRTLVERLPRRFSYADEFDFVFRPGDEA